MTCPKCGFEQEDQRATCLRCGVIFAKIRTEPAPVPPRASTPEGDGEVRVLFAELFLPEIGPKSGLAFWGRLAALVVLVAWGGKLVFSGIASNAAGESLLHLVNLPFHEAGHVLFRPLGRFMTSLGGTLGQLLVPLVCMVALLLKTRDPFGAAVCLWWFGENFLDIAPYVDDARAGQLPLVGGNFGHSSPYGFHDWEYLLTETGLLRHDHLLAQMAHGFGALVMALAVAWAGALLWRSRRRPAGETG